MTEQKSTDTQMPRGFPDDEGRTGGLNHMFHEVPSNEETLILTSLHNEIIIQQNSHQTVLPSSTTENDSNDQRVNFSQKIMAHQDQTVATPVYQNSKLIHSDYPNQWGVQPEHVEIIQQNQNLRLAPSQHNGNAIQHGYQNQRVIRPAPPNGNTIQPYNQNHWMTSTAQPNISFVHPGHDNHKVTVPGHPNGREIQPGNEYHRVIVPAHPNKTEMQSGLEYHRVIVAAHTNRTEIQSGREYHRITVPGHQNGREIQHNQRTAIPAHANRSEIQPEYDIHRVTVPVHSNGSGIQQGHQNHGLTPPAYNNENAIQPPQHNHRMTVLANHDERATQSGQQNLPTAQPAQYCKSLIHQVYKTPRVTVPANHNERASQHQNERMAPSFNNNERTTQLRSQNCLPNPPPNFNERAIDSVHQNHRATTSAVQNLTEAVTMELIAIHRQLDAMEMQLPYYEEIALYLAYQKERLKLSAIYGEIEQQRKRHKQSTDRNGTANSLSSHSQTQSVVHRERATHSESHPKFNYQNEMVMHQTSHHQRPIVPQAQNKTDAQSAYDKTRVPQHVQQVPLPLPPQQPCYTLSKHHNLNNSEPIHSSQIPQNNHKNLPPQPQQNYVQQTSSQANPRRNPQNNHLEYSPQPQQQSLEYQSQDDTVYRLIEMDLPSMRGVPTQRIRGRRGYPRGTRGRGRPPGSTNLVASPDYQQLSESLNRLSYFHNSFQSSINSTVNNYPCVKREAYSPTSANNPASTPEPSEPSTHSLEPQGLNNLRRPIKIENEDCTHQPTQVPYSYYSDPLHSPISIISISPEPQDLTIPEPPAPDSNNLVPMEMESTQNEMHYSDSVPQHSPISLVLHGRSNLDSVICSNSIQSTFQEETAVISAVCDSPQSDSNTITDPVDQLQMNN